MKTLLAALSGMLALSGLASQAFAEDKTSTVVTTTQREVLAVNPVPYLIAIGIIIVIIIAFVVIMISTNPNKGKFKRVDARDND